MACPYFIPTERFDDGLWSHPRRLPLGGGWRGLCGAPGQENAMPGEEELRSHCNLGYANACPRLPRERAADAMRFVARPSEGLVAVTYVGERNYLPGEHGTLYYDVSRARWRDRHANAGLQALAEAYLQSYLETRRRNA